MTQDEFGNCVIEIGEDSTVCFSGHLDTVHATDGMQKIIVNKDTNMVYKDDGVCLGADDGTGVWIMLQLIKAKVAGLYIFHRGEEVGGLGSKWIRDNTPELLNDIDYCVAFDRKGYNNVITHQRSSRCCSDDFAAALSDELGEFKFSGDPTGTFTDSATYTELVAECTNLSVGYFKQHSQSEYQDLSFLMALTEKLITIDWETLPVTRNPLSETLLAYQDLEELLDMDPAVVIELLTIAQTTHGDVELAEYALSDSFSSTQNVEPLNDPFREQDFFGQEYTGI